MNARRTVVRLTFDGVDISADINRYLQSLSYTDNEQDETDDLQLTLDDREGVWLGNWLNTPGASKGAELAAVIVQKNWNSDGKDRVLDCGTFQIDSVDGSGPPSKVTIKGGSIPYTSTVRTQKKTKAWEKIKLSGIANEIAGKNGLACMFESAFDPFYTRKEQVQESDITFLQRLCKAAGISLKVTAKMIVLFDAAAYEKKSAVRTIKRGAADVKRYSFNTSFHDASYSSCHVTYTDPSSGATYEATYKAPDADTSESAQVLEIKEKVSSNAEAKTLAEKRLREKNGQQFTASFTLVGDAGLVAGVTVTVKGYGAFDGKYIVERVHNQRQITPRVGGVLMGEASVYKNIVRTGWVSSVNAADRTARVTFKDMGTTFVSGPLKVIKNPPFIPAKDVVQETQTESGGSGDASFASHTHKVKISPWLPSPGDYVLCLYIPTNDGDGFVIGGI